MCLDPLEKVAGPVADTASNLNSSRAVATASGTPGAQRRDRHTKQERRLVGGEQTKLGEPHGPKVGQVWCRGCHAGKVRRHRLRALGPVTVP